MNLENRSDDACWNNEFITVSMLYYKLKDDLGNIFDESLFQRIIHMSLISVILEEKSQKDVQANDQYVPKSEIEICKRLMILNYDISYNERCQYRYIDNLLFESIKITKDTYLIFDCSTSYKSVPVFVKNIIYHYWNNASRKCGVKQFNLLGCVILTSNSDVCKYIENAIYQKFQLDKLKTSIFANSSSYMGSKKRILGFIVESILPYYNNQNNNPSAFLDIMCGSGAVSNAFAQIGEIYASDSQEFCKLLAKIQGKGYTSNRAEFLINKIYNDYMYHLKILRKRLKDALQEEEQIFHLDLSNKNKVLKLYQDFIDSFELYSSTNNNSFNVENSIERRKKNNKQIPYCLFTYYYANIYFGLLQSVQIDSIRYAIDKIENEEDRTWALGTLIIVASSIGTTHAGHFAQPKKLDINSLYGIIKQRKKSAWLEFSKRFLTIAEESQRYPYPVNTINGPWENALSYMKTIRFNKELVVYLDAPYKREEYSRYYHVLETLVKYDYPSSENKGRLRSKLNGERFNSEFFTKKTSKIEDIFVNIITEILSQGWVCAWSYSNNGSASVKNVISIVKQKNDCLVYYYETPYKHFSQRKREDNKSSRLDVTEYCIIFKPQ